MRSRPVREATALTFARIQAEVFTPNCVKAGWEGVNSKEGRHKACPYGSV